MSVILHHELHAEGVQPLPGLGGQESQAGGLQHRVAAPELKAGQAGAGHGEVVQHPAVDAALVLQDLQLREGGGAEVGQLQAHGVTWKYHGFI